MATDTAVPAIGVWIGTAVFGLLLLLRLRTLSRDWGRPQSLKLESSWITPLIYIATAAFVLWFQPPRGAEWLWLAAGLALGGFLGWWRGKTVEITVHSVTGAVTARTSPLGSIFLIGLIALRYVLRYLLTGGAEALHLTVQLITATFLALALGLVVMQRVEMTLRAVRLMGRASIAGATAPAPAAQAAAQPAAASASPTSGPAQRAVSAAGMRLSTMHLAMLAVGVFIAVVIVGLALPR